MPSPPGPVPVQVGPVPVQVGQGLEDVGHRDLQQPRIDDPAVGVPASAGPEGDVAGERRRPPLGRWDGPEEHHRGRAGGGGHVGHAGVPRHQPPGRRDQGGQIHQAGRAGDDRRSGEPGPPGDLLGQGPLVAHARDEDGSAGGGLAAGHGGEAVGGPAPGFAGRTGMDDGGAGCVRPGGRREVAEVDVARVGGDAAFGEHAAPASHLVFVGSPLRVPDGGLQARRAERHQAARLQVQQHLLAFRPSAVQVDGHVGSAQARVEGAEVRGVGHLVHAGVGHQLGEAARRGQYPPVVGEGAGQRPQRRDAGQEVTELEGPEDQHRRPAGRGGPRRPGHDAGVEARARMRVVDRPAR